MANSAAAAATQLLGTVPFFSFLLLVAAVSATDHIVGANRGWNPGVNYTLWANNHTFLVGDLIIEGATGNWSSGKDFILLDKAKRYYFICGTGGCFNGMKVSVLVHPIPPPPASRAKHSSTDSAAPPALLAHRGSLPVGPIVAVFISIWVGSGFGWIFF